MGVPYYGDFPVNGVVYIPINTFDSNDPCASVTATNLLNTDVHIHKNGGTTQRNNAAGITMAIDYDSITGNHLLTIDTSDNTVADFYQAGNEYQVRVEGVTVDGATINAWVGCFSIERANGILALLKNATYGLSALEALVDDLESRIGSPSNLGSGATVAANLVDIEGQTDDIGAAGAGLTALATAAELAKVPKSDSNVSWNATALGAIQSECTDALNAYDPPTKAELDTAQGAVTLANGAHGGASAVITLQTPIVANTTQIEGGDATNALNAATPASVQNIPVDGTLTVTLAATQPAIEWAQQTITANVAGEGALHIVNSNATGEGIHAEGVAIGQTNKGAIGQHNTGDGVGGRGQFNEASGENGIGQYNYGSATGTIGQSNYGISYGLQCNAVGTAVTPAWSTHAAADVAALVLDNPTNLLVTDASGRASANVKAVNDIAVDGAGTEGDPWGPAA